MKKPDEIKKGLECCKPVWKGDHWKNCDEKCPYSTEASFCKTVLNGDTRALIQQLEAQVPKWISVEERLPEDQRSVLTVNGHGEIRIMGLWSKRGDAWTWVHNDRMMHYNDITHWMPLPEPPKEDVK